MKRTFLEVAEIILRREKKPLKPDQIVQLAKKSGLLITEGKTPENSMKARISTEIRKNGFDSKFMRFAPNRFALREFGLKEHISQPFKKYLPNEIITCISQSKLKAFNNKFGFFSEKETLLKIISETKNLSFIDRKLVEGKEDYKQLISYVLLTNRKGDVLTYKRGAFSNAHSMIKGATCLGFGGHVQEQDTTKLFNKGFGGVFDTAEREVSEELKGVMPEELEIVGYINDDSSPEGVKHLGIVLKGRLPLDFDIKHTGKELSVNGLMFMSPKQLWNHFYEFEFWSQLLIKDFYTGHLDDNPVVIKPTKFNLSSNVIVFVGEIASGKTIICEILTQKLGYNHISTRQCVSRLIGMEDFGTADRTDFQKSAKKFINQYDGPLLLAKEIQKSIQSNTINLIDGIRHLETLSELKKLHPNLIVIFIESTRDDAFRNFVNRSKYDATIHQFREARYHPVEEEVKQLKFEADAYIFNGGTKKELYKEFLTWINQNKNYE